MEQKSNIKALIIIVNAGFSNEAIKIARDSGATGATILNARGESLRHEVFMGISVDSEKEIILCLVEEIVADKIMSTIQEKAGLKTPAHGICYTLGVEKIIGIYSFSSQAN